MLLTGHVVEEARDASMGVEFITSRRQQWVGSNLGNHISWHLCLNYLGKDCEEVGQLCNNTLLSRSW